MNTIVEYQNCQCGAVTLFFEDGASNSVKKENFESITGLSLSSLDGLPKIQNSYCCNHCVNHYGLDLCRCGFGESPEECIGGFDGCGTAREVFGFSVPFIPMI